MEFKDKVKLVRGKLLITQKSLAKELNVSFASVNRWEAGIVEPKFLKLRAFEIFCEKHNIKFD